MWALFIANVIFTVALVRHVVRMNAGNGGIRKAIYRVRDVLASVFIEIVCVFFLRFPRS